MMKITEIVEFNPKRTIKKGTIASFVEMAAVPEHVRDIAYTQEKAFTSGSKFKNGDTLFSRITPCLENGKTAKVENLRENEIGHGSTEFIVMAAKYEDDEDFVYYLSRLPEFRKYAESRMEGTSGRQRVSWQSLSDYELARLSPEDRREIGKVLRAFDDKIALNNQTNQTLEQIAQAIFKSWFVDFSPVRAKIAVLEEGGTPQQAELAAMGTISGKDAASLEQIQREQPETYTRLVQTAALFPSTMQESKLGEIPQGWTPKRIADFIELVYGKALTKTVRIPGEIPVYGSGGVNGTHNAALVEGPGIIVGRKGTVGSLYWEDKDFFPIDTVFYVKPFKGVTLEFAFYLLQLLGLEDMNTDAAVPGLNRENVYRLEIPGFDEKIIDSFTEIASSLRNKIKSNIIEIEHLTEIRDSLLPKLLSGEIELIQEEASEVIA